MTAPRLAHVILRVVDLERALAFWRDRIGLPVTGRGGAFAFLDAGGVAIALNAVASPAEPGGGLAALTEVVLEVPDVRAAHAELSARGVPFRTPPRPVTGDATRELWACDFRDPDGHLASITGWVTKPGAPAR
ncbi:MAG TPA: VOC family protein [Anaeromyxobacter sp.]|nr:VOC family protein [Anaeromyxobacter sp.]